MATPSFVNSERHCSVRVGFQFEDGEIHHGGGFGGLCVLGAEPRRLRELGAGWGAVHQDGGEWDLLWLVWARHWLISLESKRTSLVDREQIRYSMTVRAGQVMTASSILTTVPGHSQPARREAGGNGGFRARIAHDITVP